MPSNKATEGELVDLLGRRYPGPEWFLLPKVSSGPGSRQTRIADAIALNRWATRGLTVHGFEIKCERRDWMRELRAPEKAEGVGVYCDFWWLVTAGPEIAKVGELPAGWGLLVRQGKADKCRLTTFQKAEQLQHQRPVDRQFLIAALNAQDRSVERALEIVRSRAWTEGFDRGKESVENPAPPGPDGSWQVQFEELDRRVREFETASGIVLRGHVWAHGRIGEAVRALVADRGRKALEALGRTAKELGSVLQSVEEARRVLQEHEAQEAASE